MSKKVLFMYPSENYILDGVRSVLGLAVENMYAYGVVMSTDIAEVSEYHSENIDWVRDMEGEIYSVPQSNVDKHGFAKISIEELGQKMRDIEVLIPYGSI